MNVRLVTDVEYDVIRWRIKNAMDGNSELGNAKIGGKMSSVRANLVDKKLTYLAAKRYELSLGQSLKVGEIIHFIQNLVAHTKPPY